MPHFYSVVSKQEIKSSEAWNLILHERTYWTDLDQRLHQDWHDDSLKHMGNVALGEPQGTREVRLLGTYASHCNGDAAFECFPSQDEILTGTWLGSAALGLSSTALTVSASQLWHRSIAVSYSRDLPLATGHRARRPRGPQTPPSILANWASTIRHVTQQSNTYVLRYPPDFHYSTYRHV